MVVLVWVSVGCWRGREWELCSDNGMLPATAAASRNARGAATESESLETKAILNLLVQTSRLVAKTQCVSFQLAHQAQGKRSVIVEDDYLATRGNSLGAWNLGTLADLQRFQVLQEVASRVVEKISDMDVSFVSSMGDCLQEGSCLFISRRFLWFRLSLANGLPPCLWKLCDFVGHCWLREARSVGRSPVL